MTKLNFQFHSIEDEIIQVIKDAVHRYDLFLVGLQLFPEFSCQLICKDVFDEQIDFVKNSRMLMLFNYKPDLSQNDYNKFVITNKDCLIFEIGGQKEGSLKESSIATITENAETLKIWKTIIKEFKSGMLKGAWAVNPINGAKVYYKQHRYTEGAKKLFDDGIKLIPVAGWNYYILSE